MQVRAILDNADLKLRPGMYASIDVATGKPKSYITLPQTAIVYAPYGDSVFIAQKSEERRSRNGLVARQSFVRLGAKRGDQVAVLEGLPEGAMVVTAGQIKLGNGAPLKIADSPAHPVEADPKPQDQ